MLDDAALAERLGTAARALVERRYSWDAAGQTVDLFFRELLESAGPRGGPLTRPTAARPGRA